MKNLLLVVLLLVSTSAFSEGFAPKEVIEPNHFYELEVYGTNIKVVEWTPKDNSNIRCINTVNTIAGDFNQGTACYPVGKQ